MPGVLQDHARAHRRAATPVPPPRAVTGTPAAAQARTTRATSSVSRGNTTAAGSTRWLEASQAYAARVPRSALTSPATRPARSANLPSSASTSSPVRRPPEPDIEVI